MIEALEADEAVRLPSRAVPTQMLQGLLGCSGDLARSQLRGVVGLSIGATSDLGQSAATATAIRDTK